MMGYSEERRRLGLTSGTIIVILAMALIASLVALVVVGTGRTSIRREAEKDKEKLAKYEKKLKDLSGGPFKQMSKLSYQNKYPKLYATLPESFVQEKPKTIYFTFDDGPEESTEKVLDILKKNDIKATFFLVGKNVKARPEIAKRMVDEGHEIGGHSYEHKYKDIYGSVGDFLRDFNKTYKEIKKATGVDTNIFRFPGGSLNSFNELTAWKIVPEMLRRGFLFYDWNGYIGDADPGNTPWTIKQWVYRQGTPNRMILLMHDINPNTAIKLQWIIDYYKDKGYTFAKLTNEVKPILLSNLFGVDNEPKEEG
jgi:peptidoglycan/xylan/chitin deacetylase (PgdA/CDA1 family)